MEIWRSWGVLRVGSDVDQVRGERNNEVEEREEMDSRSC